MKPKTHQSASSPLSPPTFAQQSPEAPRLRESPEAPRPSIGMPPAQMPEVVPPPPGMQTQNARKKQRKAASAKAAMQTVSAATSTGSQTNVALPHTMRDILWTPASLDPIADFYDEDPSNEGFIEIMKGIGGDVTSGSGDAIAEGDGVVDIDTLERSMAEFKIGAYAWNNTKALAKSGNANPPPSPGREG